MKLSALAVVIIASLVAVPAFAESVEDEGWGPRGRRRPPPEAIDACASSASGDSCTFEGRYGSVEGTCKPGPRSEEGLACVPADRPSRSERKPRPQDEKGE